MKQSTIEFHYVETVNGSSKSLLNIYNGGACTEMYLIDLDGKSH